MRVERFRAQITANSRGQVGRQSLKPPRRGPPAPRPLQMAARIYLPEVSPWMLVGAEIDNNGLRHPHPGLPRL